jgi:hypothetical protein
MPKFSLSLIAASVACLLLGAQAANAQATRTWVSGVGDDANPCSRTAPCKTFAGAIAKTTAGGEIDALDPGGFGALTITKSITIDGGGGQVASVLVAGTNGFNVSAGATDVVTLRNLRFQGLLGNGGNPGNSGQSGIKFNTGAALNIENCVLMGFAVNAIDITPNQAGNSAVSITDTIGIGGVGGLHVLPSGGGKVFVSVMRGKFSGNSSFGVKGEGAGNAGIDMSDTIISGNGFGSGGTAGVLAAPSTGGTVGIIMTRSLITGNNTGLQSDQTAGGTAVILVANSTIGGNQTGLKPVASGQIISYKNNGIDGNFVSNGAFTSTITPE